MVLAVECLPHGTNQVKMVVCSFKWDCLGAMDETRGGVRSNYICVYATIPPQHFESLSAPPCLTDSDPDSGLQTHSQYQLLLSIENLSNRVPKGTQASES